MGVAAHLIAEARRRSGLRQSVLARRAGIPRSVLNAYERGNRQPGANALASILAAAGFDLALSPRIDRERNGRILSQVLDLAESLPTRPAGRLRYPPFARRVG